MRFFFPVSNDESTVEDNEGTVLSGPEAARLEAAVVASELAQDGDAYMAFRSNPPANAASCAFCKR